MAGTQGYQNDIVDNLDDRFGISTNPQRSNALSSKLTTVLSASYADSEIRDALRTLDHKEIRNTAETRRRLRLDVQKDVIERNGDIVRDFGLVAEVRSVAQMSLNACAEEASATETHRNDNQWPE